MRLTCSELTKTCSAQGQEVSPGYSQCGLLVATLIAWNRLGEAVPMHGRSFACGEAKISRDIEDPTQSAIFALLTHG